MSQSPEIRRSTPGQHPLTGAIPLTPARRWRAFWVCVAVAALTILDLSKVNVGLPSIEAAFGSGSTELQLIVSGYVLTFGLFLVPMGRIGDQRSRRALFLIGLTVFTLASVGCALAPNTTLLLVCRLVQGMAAGTQMPQVIGLIQELFQGKERGRAFGLFGATIGVATAFGPTLGGLMIALGGAADGWRWIFWMNLPLGVIAIALAVWMLPQTRKRSRQKLALDPIGVLLFAATIISLMWPFLFTTGASDDNPNRWWLLVAFVLFAAGFVGWERHYGIDRHPLIPLHLFSVGSYRNGTMLQAAYFAAAPSMFLLTTLYLQSGLNVAPLFAGMVTIGFALASAVSSWFGGLMVTRFGRPVVVLGLALMLVCVGGLVLAALFADDAITPVVMAGVMIIGGVGGGLVISPNQTLTLADIPVRQGGLAGSVGQLGQRVGTAVGTAVALALFYATVYREEGTGPVGSVVFHDAYAFGMIAVGVFVALAFVLAVVDLGQRRRGVGAPPATVG